jgi:hypothetical protein
LATCYRLDKYTFPVEAKQIEMGCNRKRGRPRKTKPALKYQEEDEYVFSDTDSESEAPIEVVKIDKRKKKIDEYDEAYDLPAKRKTANNNATTKPSTSKATAQPSIFKASAKPSTSKASQPTTTPSKSIFKAKSTRSNPKRGCNTSN